MGSLFSTTNAVDIPQECLDKDLGFDTSYFIEQELRRLRAQQSQSRVLGGCLSR